MHGPDRHHGAESEARNGGVHAVMSSASYVASCWVSQVTSPLALR